jgi:hypothetical protein
MKRVVAAAIATVLLGLWLWQALGALGDARRGRETAAAAIRMPSVASDTVLPAGTEAGARILLAKRLGDAASSAGLRLTLTPIPARLEGLTQARLEARGAEDRLRAFVQAAEAPPSPLRLSSWMIAPDGAGALRLTAEIAAPWGGSPAPDALRLADVPPAGPSPARTLFALEAVPDARPTGDAPPELVGIAGRLPDDAVALVKLADGTTRDIRIGETANGWRLATIGGDRVRFTKGKAQREVILPPRE